MVAVGRGLWLLSSSWDRWRALFEENGFTTLALGWPDDSDTVDEANQDPEVFAKKSIEQATDHYVEAIGKLRKRGCLTPSRVHFAVF